MKANFIAIAEKVKKIRKILCLLNVEQTVCNKHKSISILWNQRDSPLFNSFMYKKVLFCFAFLNQKPWPLSSPFFPLYFKIQGVALAMS